MALLMSSLDKLCTKVTITNSGVIFDFSTEKLFPKTFCVL